MLTIGSLCTGYGGLDIAVEEIFDAELKWVADNEPPIARLLDARFPGIPNLGDITTTDWGSVPRVDIVTGGTPCQDLSHAGRRRGMSEGTRSNLWVQMRECIAAIGPRYVIWENVRGALNARADSEVESEPGLLGVGPGRPALRALGRVLGDLADLGFDAEWVSVRASEVGAPHGRFRVFLLARAADAASEPRDQRRLAASGEAEGGRAWADARGRGRAPATDAEDLGASRGWDSRARRTGPANDDGTAADPAGNGWHRRASTPIREPVDRAAAAGDRRGPAADTNRVAGQRGRGPGELAGTPRPAEGARDQRQRDGHPAGDRGPATADTNVDGLRGLRRLEALEPDADRRRGQGAAWGPFEPAIQRWEHTLGREAPRPTEPTGRAGTERLSSRFVEWLMGLPEGWVTGLGLGRTAELVALGNGVVPQQAFAALTLLTDRMTEEAIA